MPARPVILADAVALAPIGTAAESTYAIGDTIALSLQSTTGYTSFAWRLIGFPAGSAAALSSTSGYTSSLTTDVAGEYRIQGVATGSDGTSSARVSVIVVLTPNRALRKVDRAAIQTNVAAGLDDLVEKWNESLDTLDSTVLVSGAQSVVSRAALRALSVSTLVNRDVVNLGAAATAGDGWAGSFYYDSSSTDTDDGALTIAPTTGSGRYKRIYSGPIDVRWFGAVGDGVTDDTAAITSAIQQAENGEVVVPPGTYLVSTVAFNTITTKNRSVRLRGAHAAVYSGTGRTVFKGSTAAEIIRVGDTDTTAGSSSPMQVSIEDIHLDGNSIATIGLRVTRGVNLTFKRLTASACTSKGFFLDGTLACAAGSSADLNAITFDSCYSYGNGTTTGDGGFVIDAASAVVGSFDNIRLVACQSGAGDYTGVRVSGVPGVHLQTCVIQPTGNGIEVVNGIAAIDSTYVECGGDTLNVSATTFGGSHVRLGAGSSIGNPVVDTNSTVVYDASYSNATGYGVARFAIGKPCDDASWGPPNMAGKSGAAWKRGHVWVDAYGVHWICVVSGTSEAAVFVPRDGRVIRPVPHTDMTNGSALWWAQDDMLVRGVSFVTGGAYAFTNTDATQVSSLSTYLTSTGDDLIDEAQLTYARMTGGTEVVSQARLCASASKRMAAGEELLFQGSPPNVAPAVGNKILHYLNHNPSAFTAGTGLLLIDVYPLRLA